MERFVLAPETIEEEAQQQSSTQLTHRTRTPSGISRRKSQPNTPGTPNRSFIELTKTRSWKPTDENNNQNRRGPSVRHESETLIGRSYSKKASMIHIHPEVVEVSSDEEELSDEYNSNGYQNLKPKNKQRIPRTPEDDTSSVMTFISDTLHKAADKINVNTQDFKGKSNFGLRLGNYKVQWVKIRERNSICSKLKYWIIGLIAVLCTIMMLQSQPVSSHLTDFGLSSLMTFTNGSVLTNLMSKQTPMPFELYVFNITNRDDVINSTIKAKPIIKEVGPYAFTLTSSMEIINFNKSAHETSFKRKVIFHFDQNNTKPGLDPSKDLVNHANLVQIVISRVVRYYSDYLAKSNPGWLGSIANEGKKASLNMALAALHDETELIQQSTVHDLLIGSDSQLIAKLKTLLLANFAGNGLTMDHMKKVPDKFGLLAFINGSDSSVAETTVDDGTGERGVKDLMKIKAVNGNIYNCWQNQNLTQDIQDKYTTVQANDGVFYPPLTDIENPPKHIKVFSDETQRTMNISYVKKTRVEGLPVLLYQYENSTRNVDANPELEHFCAFNDKSSPEYCQYTKGTAHLNQCIDVPPVLAELIPPILISNPHFLHATGQLPLHVDGYQENIEKHGSYVKFEPRTGVPVEIARRMQINVVAHRNSEHATFQHLRNESLALPIAWVDFSMTDKNLPKMLFSYFFIPMQIVDRLPLAGFLIAIFACAYFVRQDYIFEMIELREIDDPSYDNNNNPLLYDPRMLTIPENEDDVVFTEGPTFRPVGPQQQPPAIPERSTNPDTSGIKRLNSLSSVNTVNSVSIAQPVKPKRPGPPRRPTTLNFSQPPNSNNNRPGGLKFERDGTVTTPGLAYSLHKRAAKAINSETESVHSVMSAMAGAVVNASSRIFRLGTPVDGQATPLLEEYVNLFEDNVDEQVEKRSPSTSDSSIVEATSYNKPGLRQRISNPSTPNAPNISSPVAQNPQLLKPATVRRKHNSLSETPRGVGRSNSKTTKF